MLPKFKIGDKVDPVKSPTHGSAAGFEGLRRKNHTGYLTINRSIPIDNISVGKSYVYFFNEIDGGIYEIDLVTHNSLKTILDKINSNRTFNL